MPLDEPAQDPMLSNPMLSNSMSLDPMLAGRRLLVIGGGSGMGLATATLAAERGARVAATAGSPDRLQACLDLGADIAIDYHDDIAEQLKKATDGHGADVILDNMGAKGLPNNVAALASDGRLMVIGMQGGVKAELNLGVLLSKRASVTAMGLRGRPVEGPNSKALVVAGVREEVWPMFADGRVKPIVHARFPLRDAAEAHRMLDAGGVVGKLLLVNE